MPPVLVGVRPSDLLGGADKFRVTWNLVVAQYLPASVVDAPRIAEDVRESLPDVGAIPVSNPSALPGDRVIVYDIRTAARMAGKPVADLVAALERLAPLSGGWATTVAKVEMLATAGASGPDSATLREGQDAARQEGNKEAEASSLGARLRAFLSAGGIVIGVALLGVALIYFRPPGRREW